MDSAHGDVIERGVCHALAEAIVKMPGPYGDVFEDDAEALDYVLNAN
jgi:hypothetical protein